MGYYLPIKPILFSVKLYAQIPAPANVCQDDTKNPDPLAEHT
jgi:hypothetical protein